jgi:rubrerythrin
MSDIPKRIGKENVDSEIARAGMIAELDAVNLYEQMAAMATNNKLKEVLLDIAKEEKTHMGEFQTMLLKFDKEQVKELEEGKKEVEGM